MELHDIKEKWGLREVDKNSLAYEKCRNSKILNTWDEVDEFIKELKEREIYRYDLCYEIIGYEIKDGKIKLYYNTLFSYS